jgi:hypothetical protein
MSLSASCGSQLSMLRRVVLSPQVAVMKIYSPLVLRQSIYLLYSYRFSRNMTGNLIIPHPLNVEISYKRNLFNHLLNVVMAITKVR